MDEEIHEYCWPTKPRSVRKFITAAACDIATLSREPITGGPESDWIRLGVARSCKSHTAVLTESEETESNDDGVNFPKDLLDLFVGRWGKKLIGVRASSDSDVGVSPGYGSLHIGQVALDSLCEEFRCRIVILVVNLQVTDDRARVGLGIRVHWPGIKHSFVLFHVGQEQSRALAAGSVPVPSIRGY